VEPPNGETIRSDDLSVDEQLSRLTGRRVKLIQHAPAEVRREANRAGVDMLAIQEDIRVEQFGIAAPKGTFFDHAPVHLLTTATLRQLKQLYPEGEFDERRFRPNLVITPNEIAEGFAENNWLGKELLVGEGAVLYILDPTPRCVVTTLPQGELAHQVGILKTIAQHCSAPSATIAPGVILSTTAGVYAAVHQRGKLEVNAELRLG
jgi:uncharacterized protein